MAAVTTQDVEARMIMLRNQPVLIDADVAALYGVDTKRVNEAVKKIHRSSHMDIFLSWISMRKKRWSKFSTTLTT